MCVRCVFVFLVTALYCFSMDILSEINFMMMMISCNSIKDITYRLNILMRLFTLVANSNKGIDKCHVQ